MPNAYPSLPQMEGTKLVPRSGVKLITASNGQIRSRILTSNAFFDPTVVHTGLTQTQWNTLLTFYNANRALLISFTLAVDGTALANCMFAEKPFDVQAVTSGSGPLFNVTAYLVQAQ